MLCISAAPKQSKSKKRWCNTVVNMPLSQLFSNMLQALKSEQVFLYRTRAKFISLNINSLVFALYQTENRSKSNGKSLDFHSIPFFWKQGCIFKLACTHLQASRSGKAPQEANETDGWSTNWDKSQVTLGHWGFNISDINQDTRML